VFQDKRASNSSHCQTSLFLNFKQADKPLLTFCRCQPFQTTFFIIFLLLLLFCSTRVLRVAVIPGCWCLCTWKSARRRICNQSVTSKMHAIHCACVVVNSSMNYGVLSGFPRHLASWQIICENYCLSGRVIRADNVPKMSDSRHHEDCERHSSTTSTVTRCVCKEYVWPCLVITSGFEEIVGADMFDVDRERGLQFLWQKQATFIQWEKKWHFLMPRNVNA